MLFGLLGKSYFPTANSPCSPSVGQRLKTHRKHLPPFSTPTGPIAKLRAPISSPTLRFLPHLLPDTPIFDSNAPNPIELLPQPYYQTKLYIFLELATGGSLLNLYQKHKLSDSQASKYTRQIVKGLLYLHEHNVVHRLLGEVKSSTLPPALFQEKKNGKTKNKKKSQEHGC
ncbi:unnamed protein product, partial [Vitis vinifera]